MNLEDLRKAYYDFSGKTSDIARQLGFAGIALIWLFKVDIEGRWSIPTGLLPAGLLVVVSLAFDFFHYIVGTLIWGIYCGIHERRGTSEDSEFVAPRPINWPTLTLFWAKVITMTLAYAYIVRFLLERVLLP